MIAAKAYASQIIERARSLADLPNSTFISHTDELNSINESWKDIYSALTNSDDDYYLSESTLTVTALMLQPGTTNEYLVPLPDDFYKLRYLDYSQNNQWYPCKKFPLNMKDYSPSEPYYRIKGSTLWIIMGGVAWTGTLKIGYYPPPPLITAQAADLIYGTSYAPNLFPLVTSPVWATLNTTAVYFYNSIAIYEESIDAHTVSAPVLLYTVAGAKTNLVYYKGYLYWILAADIYRASTNLVTTPLVPAAITATANVTSFAIYNDLIYYAPGATIRTCTLAGGTITQIAAFTGSWLCLCGGIVYYIDGAANLKSITPAATVMANVLACVTDGTYLYALDTAYNLYRLTMSTVPAVTTSTLLRSDVSAIGPYYQGKIPLLTKEGQAFVAMSTEIDYYFSFPSNLVPEIMAFSCARDWRAKGKMDTEEIKERLKELWYRFTAVIKRDEYSAQRIRNEYDHHGWR